MHCPLLCFFDFNARDFSVLDRHFHNDLAAKSLTFPFVSAVLPASVCILGICTF